MSPVCDGVRLSTAHDSVFNLLQLEENEVKKRPSFANAGFRLTNEINVQMKVTYLMVCFMLVLCYGMSAIRTGQHQNSFWYGLGQLRLSTIHELWQAEYGPFSSAIV